MPRLVFTVSVPMPASHRDASAVYAKLDPALAPFKQAVEAMGGTVTPEKVVNERKARQPKFDPDSDPFGLDGTEKTTVVEGV